MYTIKKITSSPVVDFAAEELKKYLRMMMPECGEITIDFAPGAMDGFRLGIMADFDLDTSEAEDIFLDDIIHIDADTEGGIIAGSNARSVLLAVYKYLTVNGCRWLFPGIDGEQIPIKSIEPVKYHKMADCRYRGQCNEGDESQQCMIETIDFSPKIGLNVYMIEFDNPKVYYERYYAHKYNPKYRESELPADITYLQWKRACECEMAKRGLQFHDIGHSFTVEPFGIDSTLGWDDSGICLDEEKSKYLALIDGKRGLFKGAPLRTNFCMSNAEARAKVVKYVCDYAEMQTNVDYLHVWLADDSNNHCECEECKRKTASDWYVILMNEVDGELTRRELDTRIVLACYVDTVYPPETENINNPERFSILACVSGNYHQSISTSVPDFELVPYKRNDITLPDTVDGYVAYARAWQKHTGANVFSYGYHFHTHQYFCPGVISFAKIIHGDVKGISANGINGVIEDGSQRSFYPNGFCYYVYAATLFDNSVDFDYLVEDYFSHAYGAEWRTVYDFLTKLDEIFDVRYMTGTLPLENSNRDRFYNPDMADKFRSVKPLCDAMRPFAEEHKNMPLRSQTVLYRVLRRYLEYCEGLSYPLILKCMGLSLEARHAYSRFATEFGKYELEMEAIFDQGHSTRAYTHFIFGKVNNPLLIPN